MTSYHDPGRISGGDMSYADLLPFLIERPVIKQAPSWEEDRRQIKKAVARPTDEQIQRKIDNARLVAQGLEFLLKVAPSIPGASVTLTPAQQDELRQIILALPAAVVI